MTPPRAVFVVLAIGAVAACSPEQAQPVGGIDEFGATAQRDGGAGDAVAPEPLAFAVVASDYTATSIALLDADASLLAADYIQSGSAPAGLVTALSGDVVLPTRSGDPTTLTLIDRFRTDVVTRVDPGSGEILGQVKTHRPNSDELVTGYTSNPQDYVYLDEHNAWVTRFEPNLAVAPDDPDRGLDLLHLDPTRFVRGARISMWPLNSKAEREHPDTGERQRVTVYARPSGVVRLGERLVVGISRQSASFDVAGEGMVALVDLARREVTGVPLPGLQNCGSVVPVARDDRRVVVACSGVYRSVRRGTAGLALLRLQGDELVVEHVFRGADDPQAPLTVSGVVSLGGSEVVAVAEGTTGSAAPARNDRAYVLDLESGQQRELFESGGPFTIGGGAYNARRRLLMIPDASTDDSGRPTAGVRVFEREANGDFQPRSVVEVHEVLPARQVRAL